MPGKMFIAYPEQYESHEGISFSFDDDTIDVTSWDGDREASMTIPVSREVLIQLLQEADSEEGQLEEQAVEEKTEEVAETQPYLTKEQVVQKLENSGVFVCYDSESTLEAKYSSYHKYGEIMTHIAGSDMTLDNSNTPEELVDRMTEIAPLEKWEEA